MKTVHIFVGKYYIGTNVDGKDEISQRVAVSVENHRDKTIVTNDEKVGLWDATATLAATTTTIIILINKKREEIQLLYLRTTLSLSSI